MIFKSFIFPNIYHDMHANDRFCLEVNISTCYPEFQNAAIWNIPTMPSTVLVKLYY